MAEIKKKILFLVESMTDAHMARTSMLIASMAKDPRCQITLAARNFPKYVSALIPEIERKELQVFLAPAQFAEDIKNWKFPLRPEYISQAIEEDLKLINEIRPDLVIGDFRLTLVISAKSAKIPYVNLTNVSWSPANSNPVVVASHPMMRFLGVWPFQTVFDLFQKFIEKGIVSPFNKFLTQEGATPFQSLKDLYCSGDYIFYLDFAGFNGVTQVPPHHLFIGPVLFSIESAFDVDPLPEFDNQKKILISMGSSGNIAIVEMMAKSLLEEGMNVVVITANRFRLNLTNPRLRVYDFLPYGKILHRFDLLISHGGSSSVYPATFAGIPTLMIPSNFDQFMAAKIFESSRLGRLLRPEGIRPEKVVEIVGELTDRPEYKSAIREILRANEAVKSSVRFPEIIQAILFADKK